MEGAESLHLQLMLNYIQGNLGSEKDQDELLSKIVRVIILGNSFPITKAQKVKGVLRKKLGGADKSNQSDEKLEYINLLRDLDIDIANLAASVPVDILPGEFDPSNYNLPRQPLNSCLFPLSSKFSTFNRVSSPHSCTLNETIILSTTGEEISNMKQFVSFNDPVDIVSQLIELRHIAPTAPATLPAYPSEDG